MLEAPAKVVVLSSSPITRRRLLDALRSAKLHVVTHGEPTLPGFAARVEMIHLTRREVEVLVRLASGLSYQAVAQELQIGIGTVQTYVKSAYRKLGVSNKAEATRLAIRMGLVDRSD
jgi:DNA-binding NarL/FixJ family response regulator